MERISDSRKCMASLAVFKTLYDKHEDLYTVIASFSELLIHKQQLKTFNLQEFCSKFEEEYGFELPSAVIKTSLKRIKSLEVNKTNYTYKGNFEEAEYKQIAKLEADNNKRNLKIIDALNHYVETKANKILTEDQRKSLFKSFCSYVIDENTDIEYRNDISSFILQNSSNEEIIKQLNSIRIGLVNFVGLCYNTNYDRVDGIDSKLNIYLDTEILFHRAGFNGVLFKKLYDEFYSLVKEINRKAKKQLVELFYFAETGQEIRDYFAVAEDIVNGKKQLDPSKTAMRYIVSQCKSASDVKEMESIFFADLDSGDGRISSDRQEHYYDREKFSLNIEESGLLKIDGYTEEEVYDKLKLLNYINVKRGGKSQQIFRNVGHILLTANGLTFKLTFNNKIYNEGDVPLATGLDFLTNRFWMIAEKGLSSKLDLSSFKILTKAQIVMSTSVNESIANMFKNMIQQEKNGNFDLNKKKAALATFHQHCVNPEDLTAQTQDTYLNFIKTEDINVYLAERALERQNKDKELDETRTRAMTSEKIAGKALKRLVEDENSKRKKTYQQSLISYKTKRKSWVLKQLKYKRTISSVWVLGYFVVIATVFLLALYKSCLWCSIVLTLLTTVFPFIRPLWKHQQIIDSFSLLFGKKVYRCEIRRLVEEYNRMHAKPMLQLVTMEEMKSKLNDE